MRILSEKCVRDADARQKMKCAGSADRYKLCQADGKLDDHHPAPPAGADYGRSRMRQCATGWKQAVKRAEADGVHFSIPVTPHTFRHSYIMHMLYHRQPGKSSGHWLVTGIHVRWRFIPEFFALDMAATLAVPFTGDGRDAAEILRTLPPLK